LHLFTAGEPPGEDLTMITELDIRTFDTTLKETSEPLLVDFWAPWCAPCRVQLPILERVASNASGAYRIAKVNVDDNEQLAVRYGITSIPTLLLFRNGELLRRFTGLQQEGPLRAALQDAAAPSSKTGVEHESNLAKASA
jgi:thioredoxin 1